MAAIIECAYCGIRPATTRDHVPPRSLFEGNTNARLITVPSCQSCNSEQSSDDEYFRDSIAKHHQISSQPSAGAVVEKMFRALSKPRKAKYREQTLSDMFDFTLRTPSGLELGTRSAYRIDVARLGNVASRCLRGLYYHEFGSRVSETALIKVRVDPSAKFMRMTQVRDAFGGSTHRVVHQEVFQYLFKQEQAIDRTTAFLLIFFNVFHFVGLIHEKKGPAIQAAG